MSQISEEIPRKHKSVVREICEDMAKKLVGSEGNYWGYGEEILVSSVGN